MNYYNVAKILNTHGLKGELKIKVVTDFDRFYEGSKLYINYRDNYIPVTVKYSKDYKEGLLVCFKNLEDINLVEKYKQSDLVIAEEDLEELPEGLNYFHEIIDKNVYNESGELKGVCVEMQESLQSYLMCVKTDKKIVKVPFIRGVFIDRVDDSGIYIKEIEGLF